MPRVISRYRYKPTTEVLLQRRKTYRAVKGEWVDPFPHVPGTRPEKMVYAQLIWRRLPFMFQTWLRVNIPEANFDNWYRPDFILPDRKIIIEVQGAYFHSKPEQVEKDAFKYALFQHQGYRVLTWWDYEIYNNLPLLFALQPELGFTGGKRGGRIITDNQEIRDDSAGIKSSNTRRTEYAGATRRKSRAKAKTISSYRVSF